MSGKKSHRPKPIRVKDTKATSAVARKNMSLLSIKDQILEKLKR
ncbi:MAG TPA: hypothetical protein VMS89_04115 [Methanoregulaceae archaeon]|nr:hypothetical protein [Methanoregulaceae archaeon]